MDVNHGRQGEQAPTILECGDASANLSPPDFQKGPLIINQNAISSKKYSL